MVSLRTPYSGVAINVPDGLVERYTAAGYKPVEEPKKTRAKRPASKPDDEPEGDEK